MQRLKRVFHNNIEHCGVCAGTLRVIACIETPAPRAPPLHASEPQPPASPSLKFGERDGREEDRSVLFKLSKDLTDGDMAVGASAAAAG